MSAGRRGLCLAALAAVVVLCGGCTLINTSIDEPVDVGRARLEDGRTHYSMVLAQFGPPARISDLPGGHAFLYENVNVRERQIGFYIPIHGLQWIKFLIADATDNRQTLVLMFGEDGVLRNRVLAEQATPMTRAYSFQPIVSVKQMVDTKYLEIAKDQMDWGFSLLDLVPTGLNRGASVDSGQSGLELRGSPNGCGQRSLEYIEEKKRRKRGEEGWF
jgi:hypothetical protein